LKFSFSGLLWIRGQGWIRCPQRCHEQTRHSLISRINATVCFPSFPWMVKQQGSYLHFLRSTRTNMPNSYTLPVPSVDSASIAWHFSYDVAWRQPSQSASPRKPKGTNWGTLLNHVQKVSRELSLVRKWAFCNGRQHFGEQEKHWDLKMMDEISYVLL